MFGMYGRPMTRALVTLLAAAAVFAGCGGEPNDPASQVRSAVRQLVDDAHANRWGDYCAASTDPEKCQAAIATAKAMGVDTAGLVPSEDVVDGMRVTVAGDTATVDATAAKDARWVRRHGRWLWVWTGG